MYVIKINHEFCGATNEVYVKDKGNKLVFDKKVADKFDTEEQAVKWVAEEASSYIKNKAVIEKL